MSTSCSKTLNSASNVKLAFTVASVLPGIESAAGVFIFDDFEPLFNKCEKLNDGLSGRDRQIPAFDYVSCALMCFLAFVYLTLNHTLCQIPLSRYVARLSSLACAGLIFWGLFVHMEEDGPKSDLVDDCNKTVFVAFCLLWAVFNVGFRFGCQEADASRLHFGWICGLSLLYTGICVLTACVAGSHGDILNVLVPLACLIGPCSPLLRLWYEESSNTNTPRSYAKKEKKPIETGTPIQISILIVMLCLMWGYTVLLFQFQSSSNQCQCLMFRVARTQFTAL